MAFYTSTSKQVRDIHEEARRIADHQKTAAGDTAPQAENEKTPLTQAENIKQD